MPICHNLMWIRWASSYTYFSTYFSATPSSIIFKLSSQFENFSFWNYSMDSFSLRFIWYWQKTSKLRESHVASFWKCQLWHFEKSVTIIFWLSRYSERLLFWNYSMNSFSLWFFSYWQKTFTLRESHVASFWKFQLWHFVKTVTTIFKLSSQSGNLLFWIYSIDNFSLRFIWYWQKTSKLRESHVASFWKLLVT